jgi:hypothetical protein
MVKYLGYLLAAKAIITKKKRKKLPPSRVWKKPLLIIPCKSSIATSRKLDVHKGKIGESSVKLFAGAFDLNVLFVSF